MKRAFALLLITLLAFVATASAQKPKKENFQDKLSQATLALYIGKNACDYKAQETFFGKIPIWTCEFESQFTCTATVVASDGNGRYIGLTAGHCFSYSVLDNKYDYYISEGVTENPVLRKIEILKFEFNGQYDYALFTFHSLKDYPAIDVAESNNVIPPVGTRVSNINFSLGVVKEIIEGVVVSAQIGETEAVNKIQLRRRYLVQMPFGPGASGSAVVDEKTHEIVGLVEAMFPGTQMAAVVIPTGFNFKDFIEDDSVGIKPDPEPEITVPQHDKPKDDTSWMGRIRSLYHYYFK